MAVVKVLGIETEYGVMASGPDPDPIGASSALVNAYAASVSQRTAWDFEDESPGLDARGMPTVAGMAPMVETHLANTVLTNGARFYVDHAHPEYSSPECATPSEAVRYDVAGEHVLRAAMRAALERNLGPGEIFVHKNNSDGKGNSYGCHENFLVDREVPFGDVVRAMVPHLVTRILYTGSGKVGAETGHARQRGVAFQLSQRAEFVEEVVGLETTLKRPIVNTRDEPHGDPRRYRRLHVIVGDANMSQVATLLKLGTTALLLGALEDLGVAVFPESPADPVRTMHEVACDLDLTAKFELAGGGRTSALDVQAQLLELAERYVAAPPAATTRRARSSPGGRTPSRRCARTPRRSRPPSTGSRSVGSSRGTARATTSPRRTRGSTRWTCSTTTCAPSAASRREPASTSSSRPRTPLRR